MVLFNGFAPSLGDSFEVLQYGQLSGDFGTVSLPALGSGLSWERATSATAMTITVVPEPSPHLAVLAGLACGVCSLRRRRPRA
ncbi:MAG: PEP-CTERM sorting domain-containing protein [Planctomycetota bacterium]